MKKLSYYLLALLSMYFLLTSVITHSQAIKEKETMILLSDNTLSIPQHYTIADNRSVMLDGEYATLTRYIRKDNRNINLGGEHFSTITSNTGLLKGFSNISLDLVGKPLPSRKRSEEIARKFLQEKAPDLLQNMKISWIEPHDEFLKVTRNGQEEMVTISGMKVKARNMQDKLWFWVIVGGDEQPMVFERDIVWINFPGKRQTEKWLHDSWLIENN